MRKIIFSKNKVPKYVFFITMLVCWCAAFSQEVEKHKNKETIVPAFQNEAVSLTAFQTNNGQTLKVNATPDKLTKSTASYYLQTLLKQIDPDAALYSSYTGSDYSDFYCYSPAINKKFQVETIPSNGCNLQIVFTWDKNGTCKNIYLGMPCIEYDF